MTPVLPAITAPTLIMNRKRSRAYPSVLGGFIAERIPNSEFRELDGRDELYFMATPNPIVQHTREFLTGEQAEALVERVLATVLFVDIVGSTEALASQGDQQWRDRVMRFHQTVRNELGRFRGREVDNAGDGMLATFDGPARALRCGARPTG